MGKKNSYFRDSKLPKLAMTISQPHPLGLCVQVVSVCYYPEVSMPPAYPGAVVTRCVCWNNCCSVAHKTWGLQRVVPDVQPCLSATCRQVPVLFTTVFSLLISLVVQDPRVTQGAWWSSDVPCHS